MKKANRAKEEDDEEDKARREIKRGGKGEDNEVFKGRKKLFGGGKKVIRVDGRM